MPHLNYENKHFSTSLQFPNLSSIPLFKGVLQEYTSFNCINPEKSIITFVSKQNNNIVAGTNVSFSHVYQVCVCWCVCVIYFVLAKCTMSTADTKEMDRLASGPGLPTSAAPPLLYLCICNCIYCRSVAQNICSNAVFEVNFQLNICHFISVLPSFT